jgi:hypothetical protein
LYLLKPFIRRGVESSFSITPTLTFTMLSATEEHHLFSSTVCSGILGFCWHRRFRPPQYEPCSTSPFSLILVAKVRRRRLILLTYVLPAMYALISDCCFLSFFHFYTKHTDCYSPVIHNGGNGRRRGWELLHPGRESTVQPGRPVKSESRRRRRKCK